MAARQSLSKKRRFEIFKRDQFQCQYCGAVPPHVVLEVDHIDPVAAGGKNDSDNLITSCFDCNRGKSDNSLSVVPESLREKAKRIKESELQLAEYRKIIEKRLQRLEDDVWEVVGVLFNDKSQTRNDWFISIKNFIESLGFEQVIKAAEITITARSMIFATDARRFKYFCGICWNLIRG